MKRVPPVAVSFVVIAALFVACEGRAPPSEGEGEGEGEPPLVATPDELADAVVAYIDACGAAIFGPVGEQEPAFFARVLEIYEDSLRDFVMAELTSTNATFDGVRAAECIAALGDTAICATDFHVATESCRDVTIGSLPLESPCAFDGECEPGLHCRRFFSFVLPSSSPDEFPCGSCSPISGDGGRCRASFGCERGLTCVDGTCVVPLVDGDACDVAIGCHDNGLLCEPSTSSCVRIDVADVGEPCDEQRYCVDSLTKNDCTAGTCTALPTTGQSCADTFRCDATESICDFDLGSCVAEGREGDACADDLDCQMGFICDRYETGVCISSLFPLSAPVCVEP